MRFTVKVPNPRWQGAPDLQAVMEESEAEVVSLEVENEAGINLDAPFIAQTEHHVERGYGDARYVGLARDESGVHETVFSTKLGTEETTDEVAVDPKTGEVPQEALREHLETAGYPEETGQREGEGQNPR